MCSQSYADSSPKVGATMRTHHHSPCSSSTASNHHVPRDSSSSGVLVSPAASLPEALGQRPKPRSALILHRPNCTVGRRGRLKYRSSTGLSRKSPATPAAKIATSTIPC
jgi:hypothetical protein